jgi:hypothetical protein
MKRVGFFLVLMALNLSNYALAVALIGHRGKFGLAEEIWAIANLGLLGLLCKAYFWALPDRGLPMFWIFFSVIVPGVLAEKTVHGSAALESNARAIESRLDLNRLNFFDFDWVGWINQTPPLKDAAPKK